MGNASKQAETLIEALPYIKQYYGKTIVVKYGGKAMLTERLKESFASDVVLMRYVGINPVIIHGGGPQITDYMKKLNKDVKFVGSLRVTDAETMEIVKMVLVGKINKELVQLINRHGSLAVGLSGEDGFLLQAEKKYHREKGKKVDLGYVGDVSKINADILLKVIEGGYIPVIASVGTSLEGDSYNINADIAAGEVASALKAEKIIFLTDVDGLYKDLKNKKSLISEITLSQCQRMIEKKKIEKGMLPKVEACIRALWGGVKKAHIIKGTKLHALLLEVFTDKGVGTMIISE